MAVIRELAATDADAFQALRLQALLECPSAFASSYDEECDVPITEVAERLRTRVDRFVLGASDQSRLIGMVGLKREQPRKLAHKAFIWGMYVASSARRSGVGRQLMSEALARAPRLGVTQVNLGVNATNVAAIALYQAIGFTTFGVERGFMLLDGQLHDEILMVHMLPAT